MIDETIDILPGMVVRHDEGLRYQVEDTRQSTNGYEQTHQLGAMVVNYTQLEQGSFPVGTKWNKDEAGFRAAFTLEYRPNAVLSQAIRAQLFIDKLMAHAADAAERNTSNELYAERIRSATDKVKELLATKTGEFPGVATSWTTDMQPLIETLYGRSIEGEPLGAFKDFTSTAIEGIYARTRIVSIDEMFGPSLTLDLVAEDSLPENQ